MKKLLALLLCFCLALGLASCAQQASEPSSSPSSENSSKQDSSTPEPEKTSLDLLRESFPRLDGSTSLIPLEAGVRAALFGISQEEATKQVVHSTTWDSYRNLLAGDADLIFTVPLSQEQLDMAGEQGVELEQVPIAREGFVFVVNAKNPVRSLTQEQLRKIYSGEITNWKDVGGEDAEIVAYQRNNDSGSQNYMISFMGDTPLMDAPTEKRPASMSGLMDVIAVNDYAEQSIGYSVYAYAADMYGNGDEIRFIEVDGVAPSKATMASGAYPLLSNNYAVFRADEPADSPVRTLCDWMTSDEGQRAIADAGYVTVRDIGYDYSNGAQAFRAVGTAPAWEPPHWASLAENAEWGQSDLPLQVDPGNPVVFRDFHESDWGCIPYTLGTTYTLSCLTNQTLQKKINDWIASAVADAESRSEELAAFIDKTNETFGGDYARFSQHYSYMEAPASAPSGNYCTPAQVWVRAKNGYIWAVVSMVYNRTAQDGEDCFYRTVSRTWNMETGEPVELAALFREGTQIDELLNRLVREQSQKPYNAYNCYIEMSGDFTELPETGWCVTPEGIYVDSGTANFVNGVFYAFNFGDGCLAAEQFRDMTGLFNDEAIVANQFAESINPVQRTYVNDELFDVELLDENYGDGEIRAKINADFLERVSSITEESAREMFDAEGKSGEISFWWYGWGVTEYVDRYAVFSTRGSIECMVGNTSYMLDSSSHIWIYDLRTGERLEWTDLFDNWEDAYAAAGVCDYNGNVSPLKNVDFEKWNPYLNDIRFDYTQHPDQPFCVSFQKWLDDGTDNELDVCFPLSALGFPEKG